MTALFALLTASHVVQNVIRISKWYNQNKFAQTLSAFPFGFGYAGGTVLGYHGFSQFFKPKWRYLGSPQRPKKL